MENRNSKFENRTRKPESRRGFVDFRFSNFEFRITDFRFPVSSFLRWAAALAALAYPAVALAQGCPLCYNTAAAAKASAIQALRSGILILIVPPLLICAGILWRGIKARNTYNEPEETLGGPDRELAGMVAETAPPEETWKIENGKAKIAQPAS